MASPRAPSAADAAVKVKRIVAGSIRKKLEEDNISASAFARRIKTGRVAVRRLLDPNNTAVTLKTIAKATTALGLEIAIGLRPMSLAELEKIADRYVETPDAAEAARLEAAFLAGYYGRDRQPVDGSRSEDAKALQDEFPAGTSAAPVAAGKRARSREKRTSAAVILGRNESNGARR